MTVFRCPDCHAVLLTVMDPSDSGLPAEMETKVDGHSCKSSQVALGGDLS